MKSLVKIVEIYSGTFRRDFTLRGYIQPIPGSSIEHAGCERVPVHFVILNLNGQNLNEEKNYQFCYDRSSSHIFSPDYNCLIHFRQNMHDEDTSMAAS